MFGYTREDIAGMIDVYVKPMYDLTVFELFGNLFMSLGGAMGPSGPNYGHDEETTQRPAETTPPMAVAPPEKLPDDGKENGKLLGYVSDGKLEDVFVDLNGDGSVCDIVSRGVAKGESEQDVIIDIS